MMYKFVLTLMILLIAMRFDRGQTEGPDWPAMIIEHIRFDDEVLNSSTAESITKEMYNFTRSFMSTFRNDMEKNLLYQQMIGCPYDGMCGYTALWYIERATPCCQMSCSCHFPACLRYHTCCLDIVLQNMNIETIRTDLSSHFKTSCVPRHLAVNEIKKKKSAFDGAFMIDSCPVETDVELRKNCTRDYRSKALLFQDITPVLNTGSDTWYRNIYCAYCNGVNDDDNLTSSDIELTCREKLRYYTERDIIEMAFDGRFCDVQFTPKLGLGYDSCDVSISDCSSTGQWFENNPEYEIACAAYYAPIFVDDRYYRNIFCALCNDVLIDKFVCDMVDVTEIKYTFSGLLQLEYLRGMKQHNVISGENRCTESQHYDPLMDLCRDIICSPMMPLNNGKCMEILGELRSGIYAVYLKAHPIDAITLTDASYIIDVLAHYLKTLPQFGRFFIWGPNVVCHAMEDLDNSFTGIENVTLEYYKIRFQFGVKPFDTDTASVIYEELVTLQNSIHTVSYMAEGKSEELNIAIEVTELDPKPFNRHWYIYSNNASNNYELYHANSLVSLHPEFDKDFVRLNTFIKWCMNNDDILLEFHILHLNVCPKVLIKSIDYDWKRTDNGFVFLEGDFTVSFSDAYVDINKDLVICTDPFNKFISQVEQTLYKPSLPLGIISVTSSVSSILSLVFTLAIFLLLPRLRLSFPGFLNISLILVLVCAQCLYLVSSMGGFNAGSPLCIAVGILLHYFWLLSIMWMNVCTYHMFYVIRQISTILPRFTWGRFIKYHVYAVVMAFIPVVVNVSVSMATSGKYGYGDTTCYISSQDMVLYTFGIPVLIIILSNLTMYFVMVYKIGSSPSVRKNVKNERNDFVIFVKLSTVTGATWIFGFIYTWTDFIVMSYLFILFNAGQGIFIMFSLVLNRRVFNMFKTDVLGRSSLTTTDNVQKTM